MRNWEINFDSILLQVKEKNNIGYKNTNKDGKEIKLIVLFQVLLLKHSFIGRFKNVYIIFVCFPTILDSDVVT